MQACLDRGLDPDQNYLRRFLPQGMGSERFLSALYDESSSDEEEDEEEEDGQYGVQEEQQEDDGTPFNMADVKRRLPPGWEAAQVMARHRKPCSVCGTTHWLPGDW